MSKKMLLAVFAIFSASSLMATVSEDATMTVSFDIFDEGYTEYMDFGFASNAEGRSTIESIDADIATNWKDSIGNVYAYWDVVSTLPFSLELYTEPLVSNLGNTIDWTVSWEAGRGERLYIGGGKYGISNSMTIYTRSVSIGSSLADKGQKKLEIDVPVDESLPSGEYSGQIVMRLESI